MELRVSNVNDALFKGVQLLRSDRCRQVVGRTGTIIEYPEPVLTVYGRPDQRVLTSKVRNAHPFFHLFESLWMLAGRDDVGFVKSLLPRMGEYSDDGTTMQGAYGARWRWRFDFDQLKTIIAMLRRDPKTRRAVLAMWHPDDLKIVQSKDIPCNTTVYFKSHEGRLSMTICNRSNDMLWGAYGANAVHFSMLMEYVAGQAELRLGKMYQMSDSLHVYLEGKGGDLWARLSERWPELEENLYRDGKITAYPLGAGDSRWDEDLHTFFDAWDRRESLDISQYQTGWWRDVAIPMWVAWLAKSVVNCDFIRASDWRWAAKDWLYNMRKKMKEGT